MIALKSLNRLKREKVYKGDCRNSKNCINCPKAKLTYTVRPHSSLHSYIEYNNVLRLYTGDNKFQWSRFASVNKTNLRHKLFKKIARLKPQILKKQPLRQKVHCIVYAPPISFRFSRVPRGTRKKQTAWAALLNAVLWLVRYGPVVRKQSHRGKDSQSESLFGMVLVNCYNGLYTAVRLRPTKGLQVYERVGISLVEVYKWGREICHFRR